MLQQQTTIITYTHRFQSFKTYSQCPQFRFDEHFQNYFNIFTSPFHRYFIHRTLYLNSSILFLFHAYLPFHCSNNRPPPLLFCPCFEQSLTSHCERWPSIIYARNDGIPLNQSRSPVPNEL